MANCIEATLCYIRRKDEVLMLHRNTCPDDLHYGRYNGLGGKCEPGESPWQCALREIREESGLQPQRLRFAGHILFPLFDGKQDWSVFLFCGYEAVGELLARVKEGTLEWVHQEHLLQLPLWEGDRHFLPWVLAERRFLARFEYDAGVYKKHEVHFIDEEDLVQRK